MNKINNQVSTLHPLVSLKNLNNYYIRGVNRKILSQGIHETSGSENFGMFSWEGFPSLWETVVYIHRVVLSHQCRFVVTDWRTNADLINYSIK